MSQYDAHHGGQSKRQQNTGYENIINPLHCIVQITHRSRDVNRTHDFSFAHHWLGYYFFADIIIIDNIFLIVADTL
ncbi:hypothetical protein D3C74_283870 [compost metagenome]